MTESRMKNSKKIMKKILLFSLLSFLFSFEFTRAEFIVPPLPSTPVYDEVGLLSVEEKTTLKNTILTLEKETNHQIGIAIIKSLQGRTVEEVGITLARSWWIGQKWLDNGLLILVAPSEREMRIEVGRGLEWVMTDLMSRRIIDENLTPNFKAEQYGAGLIEWIERMSPLLRGEVVELPEEPINPLDALVPLLFWLVWWGIFLGSAIFEPSKAWWPGIVIGAILWGIVMWITVGTVLMTVIGVILSSGILWGLDFIFSKGVVRAINSRPHGGRWWGGGGFGGGSSGGGWGGFGGGGFGWGGSSGRW
jgi:uncharacterized protein